MANELIQKHKFENAKNRICIGLKKVPSTVSLNRFPTEGSIFSCNNHNITGAEANRDLVTPLQETLMTQNTSIKDLFNIANDVYNALDSLDSEYIAGIVTALKAAEVASNQAKAASDKATQASNKALDASCEALEASNKAKVAQDDIKRTIEALQQTVRVLKEFKERVTRDFTILSLVPNQIETVNRKLQFLEQSNENLAHTVQNIQKVSSTINRISHLCDLDDIWSQQQKHKSAINGLFDKVMPFMEKVNKADLDIREQISDINNLIASYSHLDDIDNIWSDVEGHKTNLDGLHKQVDGFVAKVNEAAQRINNSIAALQEYRTQLESYAHLGDIDVIWSDVEGHKTDLDGLHKQVDRFINETRESESSILVTIEELANSQTRKNLQVDKKIKIAYSIACATVGISSIQLVLQLIGVL